MESAELRRFLLIDDCAIHLFQYSFWYHAHLQEFYEVQRSYPINFGRNFFDISLAETATWIMMLIYSLNSFYIRFL